MASALNGPPVDGEFVTLGEKLAATPAHQTRPHRWVRGGLFAVVNAAIWASFATLVLLWAAGNLPLSTAAYGAPGLVVAWIALSIWATPKRPADQSVPHVLLAGDQQGFMRNLRLDAKTAVLDGNNIYHFGLANELGSDALRLVVRQLRTEGFRIVCFFDANIHYTLIDNGDAAGGQRHTSGTLMQVFGLMEDEIYVVPSGVQADKYILSTLKHVPISFAVTNDQFRDYAKVYPLVMKGDQWRKSLSVQGTELRLHKFRFKTPLRLGAMSR